MFGIGTWIKLGLALAVVAALAYGYHRVAEHFREEGRSELRPEIAELRASIAATQQRATALALLWSSQVDKTETASHLAESNRAQTFASLQKEAAAVPHGHLGGISLFDRARSAASGEATGPAPQPDQATPAPASSAEEFVVAMYAWAGECRARVMDWAEFYYRLQDATEH